MAVQTAGRNIKSLFPNQGHVIERTLENGTYFNGMMITVRGNGTYQGLTDAANRVFIGFLLLNFVNQKLVVTATHKPKVKILRNAVVRFPWAARTGAEVGVVVAGEDASTLELVATAANDVLIGMVIRGMGDSHVMLDTAIRTA